MCDELMSLKQINHNNFYWILTYKLRCFTTCKVNAYRLRWNCTKVCLDIPVPAHLENIMEVIGKHVGKGSIVAVMLTCILQVTWSLKQGDRSFTSRIVGKWDLWWASSTYDHILGNYMYQPHGSQNQSRFQ